MEVNIYSTVKIKLIKRNQIIKNRKGKNSSRNSKKLDKILMILRDLLKRINYSLMIYSIITSKDAWKNSCKKRKENVKSYWQE